METTWAHCSCGKSLTHLKGDDYECAVCGTIRRYGGPMSTGGFYWKLLAEPEIARLYPKQVILELDQ